MKSIAYAVRRTDPNYPSCPQYLCYNAKESWYYWSTLAPEMRLFFSADYAASAVFTWKATATKTLGDLGWKYELIEIREEVVEEINIK